MAPKPKPNTCLATAQAPSDSRKYQGSKVDQLKTKRTQQKTNKANEANDNDDDDDLNKSEDEQEAADGVEDKDNPPALRGGKRGHAVKKGLPGTSGTNDRGMSPPTKLTL